MNKLQTWYEKHKGISHAIAGAAATLVSVYLGSDQAKAIIDGYLEGHKNLSALFTLGVLVYLNYRKSQKV
jgi:hypothetical protein